MGIRFAAVAFLIAVGCDSAESTCTLTNSSEELVACIEYAGAIADRDAKASCEGGGGSWQEGPCADGAVASCVAYGSTSYYYAGYLEIFGLTVAELRTSCEESDGAFTEL